MKYSMPAVLRLDAYKGGPLMFSAERVSALRAPDRESYRNKGEASEAITSQAAAHSPSDISNTTVKDTPSDH